jgi:uncharacterized repeat protein (TIGR03806 family)
MKFLPIVIGLAIWMAGCGGTDTSSRFIAEGNPPNLSAWGQLTIEGDRLVLGENVEVYELNSPLFTDYAHKLRTIWMPPGTSAVYQDDAVFDFPIGTVITKTFYYPRIDGLEAGHVGLDQQSGFGLENGFLDLRHIQLIETRILVRRTGGWVAIPYLWNDDQSLARLNRTGAIIPLRLVDPAGTETEFNYIMPDVNQCASCHAPDSTTRILSPIGPKARHLNRDFHYADGPLNQIDRLVEIGFLTGAPSPAAAPRNADWSDTNLPLEDRARAYLDINCSHCHSRVGPADTSGLFLEPETPTGPSLGICKLPIAAGAGTGDRLFDIVPGQPDASIIDYRLDNLEPDEMMPELGRSTIHREGVALIRAWITSLEGDCSL